MNGSIIHEVHQLLKVDKTLTQLKLSVISWMLTVDSGSSPLPRNHECSPPSVSYMYLGSTVPGRCLWHLQCSEDFQARMNRLLSDVDSVLCLMDDVLVFEKEEREHNDRLAAEL